MTNACATAGSAAEEIPWDKGVGLKPDLRPLLSEGVQVVAAV